MTNIVSNSGLLSRSEMKTILAGSCSGNECTNCLICWNESGGYDIVPQEFNEEDPNQACRRYGPYDSGSWGQCY